MTNLVQEILNRFHFMHTCASNLCFLTTALRWLYWRGMFNARPDGSSSCTQVRSRTLTSLSVLLPRSTSVLGLALVCRPTPTSRAILAVDISGAAQVGATVGSLPTATQVYTAPPVPTPMP